ncbi:MFS transporter [Streptomyces umbrinus]|uniref:MFS transporter n=1 Tax=Streptomyces umbrinus TaxID=67370 RepID=UPI0034093ABE
MPPIQPASDQTGKDAHLRTNILVAVLAFAGITDALTQALVYPIVPHLPRYLNASASDTAWTVTVILLCGAVATPVMGRLGDMYGKRRMLLFNVGLLVAGSVICALSDSLAPMIVGRALQGLANGIIPLGVSILRDEVPVARLPMATAVMLGSLGVGAAIGLPASAFIADNVDWHLLFWAGAALAAVAAVLVVMYVPESKVRTGGRVDVTGALGMTAGLVCLLLAISKGEDWGWDSGTTLALFAAALLILPLWGWFELRTSQPMVDLRTAARPVVLFTNLAAVAIGFTLLALQLVLPQLLQLPESTGYGLGTSLVVTGMVLAPQGLVLMAVSPLSARITRLKGPRTALMLGSTVIALGYLLTLVMMSEIWQLIVASCVVATGAGLAYAALPMIIMGAVPLSETAAATSFNALMRAIGNTVASAVAGAIIANMTISFHGARLPSENGLRVVVAIGVAAAAAAFTVALLIPRSRVVNDSQGSLEPLSLGTVTGKPSTDA